MSRSRCRRWTADLSRSEDGVALVVALVVTVLAFLIMTGILAQSIHNIVESGYSRRRMAAVNAAEAGLNWYANRLSRTSLTTISSPSFGWKLIGDWYVKTTPEYVSGKPDEARFQLKVRYSDKNPCSSIGDPSTCLVKNMSSPGLDLSTFGAAKPFPSIVYAIVRSVGTVGNIEDTNTLEGGNGSVQRVLEEYVRLRAQTTVVSGGLSAISLCMSTDAKVTVDGDLAVNNQKTNGSLPAIYESACNQTFKSGDIVIDKGKYLRTRPWAPAEARGDLLIRGGGLRVEPTKNLYISGDLWVENEINLGCNLGSTCPEKVSSACVYTGTVQCVAGDAYASGIFQGPNGHIQGAQTVCTPACPPEAYFTEIKYVASEWQGWQPVGLSATVSPDTLKSKIEAAVTQTVIHIDGTNCDIEMPTGKIYLKTSVAVVSECGYSFVPPGTTLIRNSSTCGSCSLLVLSVIPTLETLDSMVCATPGLKPAGSHNIAVSGNQNFGTIGAPGPGLFLYTPCFLLIQGNQCQGCTDDPSPDDIDTGNKKSNANNELPIQGQFIARYMIIKNSVRLIQNDIGNYITSLPGQVSSFKQDVKFVREITFDVVLCNKDSCAGP